MRLIEFQQTQWTAQQKPWTCALSVGDCLVCEVSPAMPIHFMSERCLESKLIRQGRVLIKGHDFADYSEEERDAVYSQIGWILKETLLISTLSLEDNLCLPVMAHVPLLKRDLRSGVMRLTRRFGLDDHLPVRPHASSARNLLIISMLRAFVHDPALVFSFVDFHGLEDSDAEAFLQTLQVECDLRHKAILFFQRQGNVHPLLRSFQRGPSIICD